MFENFDFAVISANLGRFFLEGMGFTLRLTFFAGLAGFLLGTSLTLVRMASVPFVSRAIAVYINFIRSMPLVLLIFWFNFLLPGIWQEIIGSPYPITFNPLVLAFWTFTLFEAAYFAEIMRAGILSIPQGQAAAGRALGLTGLQVSLFVVLPQAFKNVLPVLLTQLIALFQDTTLVYIIGLKDFFRVIHIAAVRDGRQVELFIFAAVVYCIISYCSSLAVKKLQKPQQELWA
ncbi:MAG: amino acid ABC transporter permease [Methylobacteriaceae bacterium]|jgi:glutamate/aspartate transport system permease protein|nr:amino acid ABC transporter permease [Methylobacteriaceae bacterium]